MKLNILLLALSVAILMGCKKEDDGVSLPDTLHLDGENQSAPILPAGIYEAAARFDANLTSEYTGRKLESVSFFMGEIPAACVVKIYDEGTPEEPGALLYSADVRSQLSSIDWNEHFLSDPVEITGKDLWIAIRVAHNGDLQSVGCDTGPAVTDGDWLFQNSDNDWLPLRQRLPININWNIRGHVGE